MARYEHLPIWRAAMDLALGLEQAAAGFPRVHRYALGAELRRSAQQILGGVMRCARAREQREGRRERQLAGVFQPVTAPNASHPFALSTPSAGVMP
jgi:hypothetical protein